MAAREIKASLKLDGETKFKNAVKGAKTELAALRAELRAQTAQFKAQGDAQGAAVAEAENLRKQQEQQAEIVRVLEEALAEANEKYGEGSKKAQDYRIELANAQAALVNLTTRADAAAAAAEGVGESMDASEVVDAADDSNDALDGIIDRLDTIAGNTSFSAMCDGLDLVLSAAGKAFDGVKKLYDLVGEASEWADDLEAMSITTGIDMTTLQQMQYAADQTNSSVDDIVGAIKRLRLNMTDSKKMTSLAEALGVSAYGSDGKLKDSLTFFNEIMAKAHAMGIDLTKDAEMAELFSDAMGKGSNELQPLINNYEEYLRLMGLSEDKGYVLDEEEVSNLTEYNNSLKELTTSLSTLERVFASTLAPTFQAFNEGLTDVINDVTTWLRDSDVAETLSSLTETVGSVMGMISELASGDISFADLLDTIEAWLTGDGEGENLSTLVANSFTNLIDGITSAFLALFEAGEDGESIVDKLGDVVGAFVNSIFTGLQTAVTAMIENTDAGEVGAYIGTAITGLLDAWIGAVSALFDYAGSKEARELFGTITSYIESLFNGLIEAILQYIDSKLGTNLSGHFGDDAAATRAAEQAAEAKGGFRGNYGKGFMEYTDEERLGFIKWVQGGAMDGVKQSQLADGIVQAFLESGMTFADYYKRIGAENADEDVIANMQEKLAEAMPYINIYIAPDTDITDQVQDELNTDTYTIGVDAYVQSVSGVGISANGYVDRAGNGSVSYIGGGIKGASGGVSQENLDGLASRIVKGISGIGVYLDGRKVGMGVAPTVDEYLARSN